MSFVVPIQELQSVKSQYSMEGRKALVTGAAGGIGRSVSAALADMGADVALIDVRKEEVEENAEYIAAKYGVKTVGLSCDVSDEAQVREMMMQVIGAFGFIDAVHSNAGILMPGDNGDMELEKWKRIVDVNLTGMFLINQKAAQHMRDSGRAGAIVNTASMSGHIVNRSLERHAIGYPTTKGAVLHLTKAMAMDFCKYNIRINSVSPGYMYSGIHDNIPQKRLDFVAEMVPMGRFGSMDEIGGIVTFLLSNSASYITGADILVDGGHCVW